MYRQTFFSIFFTLSLVLCSFHLFAFTEVEKPLPCSKTIEPLNNEIKRAKALHREAPKYPVTAARKRQEGWVRLSFVVDKDGSVKLPIVEDSSGIKSFETAAKNAVKHWSYQPAMQNGETIQQCRNSVQLDFKMNKKAKGASRGFVKEYRKLQTLINDNELTEAKIALDSLTERTKQNFYEDRFYFNIQSSYYQAIGDKQKELIALKKLIPQGKDYLPKGAYVYAVVRAFQLAMMSNEFASALYYNEQLKKFDDDHEKISQLAPYVEQIQAFINSKDNIFVSGEINERQHWRHYLARKNFTFTNIEGTVDSVDIRCANHFSSHQVSKNKEWKIPKSWGKCQVFIQGEIGAKFNLVELASAST